MTVDIGLGENIRRLRRAKDVTQEEMADALGVSFQSVSKWERGECFPDISLLPGLAHYFDVTADELLGMDRTREKRKMDDAYRRAHEYEEEGRYAEAISLLRDSLKTYPDHPGYMSELALALTLASAEGAGEDMIREAIALSERVLAGNASDKCKSTTRANLTLLLKKTGEGQKALEFARSQSHAWESREMLALDLLEGAEREQALKKTAALILSLFFQKMDGGGAQDWENAVKRIALGSPEVSVERIPEMAERIIGYFGWIAKKRRERIP